jgi:tRNA synthetases class I (E and Q), anti-codon binding domain
LEEHVNKNSLIETTGFGDSALRSLNKGDKIQLERKGYFIVDSPFLYPNKPPVFVLIPDGTAATLSAENEKDKKSNENDKKSNEKDKKSNKKDKKSHKN